MMSLHGKGQGVKSSMSSFLNFKPWAIESKAKLRGDTPQSWEVIIASKVTIAMGFICMVRWAVLVHLILIGLYRPLCLPLS